MRNIRELKQGIIECNSFEEYVGIKKLLRTASLDNLKEWWNRTARNGKNWYVIDSGSHKPDSTIREAFDLIVYQASEFLPKKEFPKEWAVQNDGSQRFKDTVVRYINTFWIKGEDLRAYYGWIDNRWQVVGSLRSGTSLLTLNEFEEILNNQKSKEMAKKIIGFKCPVSMHNDFYSVPKGTVFKEVFDGEFRYYPEGNKNHECKIPKEIVESWEPVYKDEKIIVPGSSYEVVIVSRNTTMIDGNEFKRSFWASALDVSMHSKAEVKIGCSKQFTLNQAWIESVLDAMERMN